jgi:HAD superfamily hydrolase (TIGR01509 family)
MNIRNILWDVDGTLFDTYPAITYALSQSFIQAGAAVPLNLIDELARRSIEGCIRVLSARYHLDPEAIETRFADTYRTVDPAMQRPYPGVREVCALIHARGGLNLIVTHRGVASTQRMLDVHGMRVDFDDVFSVEQGYARKPDPAMALAALQKYSLDPGECLFVGDRELDIQAGRAAGVRTCLFGETELAEPADLHIEQYAQLLNII